MKQKTAQSHNVLMSTALVKGENLADYEAADQSRRRFMKLNVLGIAVASTGNLFVSENAWAVRTRETTDDKFAILDPNDSQAQALSYTRQTSKDRQSCSNCQLYTGADGAEAGPCAIFSYRVSPDGKQLLVDAIGWCRAWAPRQES